jgi:hypothetical protein
VETETARALFFAELRSLLAAQTAQDVAMICIRRSSHNPVTPLSDGGCNIRLRTVQLP